MNLVSKRRQTLMFSATMPGEIRRLANAFLTDPKEVQATPPATMVERIEDHIAIVPPRHKFKALRRLIEDHDVDNALIFCNRKREVASLRRQMERAGLSVRDIHGDLDQSQRTAALDAFKHGEIAFLVATDVAARGLDIAMLPCVINYDVPTHADDYVHRHRPHRPRRPGGPRVHAGAARGAALRRCDHAADRQGDPAARDRRAWSGGGRRPAPARARPRRGRAARSPRAAAVPAPARRRRAAPQRRPSPRRKPRRAASRAAGGAGAGGPRAASPAPRRRRRPRGRRPPRPSSRGRGRPRAARRGPASSASAAPSRQRRGASAAAPRRRHGRDRPVVGMGDHVPLFMRRPVPQIAAAAGGGRGLMQTIFVMVKCELGRAYDVADAAVQNVEAVSEVHSISGQYDLLMKFYLDDAADIGRFVTSRVQTLDGVKDTFTLIAFKAFT